MIRQFVKFKPKKMIWRFVKTKGGDRVILYPGTTTEGELLRGGQILTKSNRYDGEYVLERSEVKILEYL